MAEHTEEKGLLNSRSSSYRRYGSTTCNTKKPEHVVCHKVKQEDTIQGIALRYGATVELVKLHNKLWSPESIYLHDYLEVPVTKSIYDAFIEVSGPSPPAPKNGLLYQRNSIAGTTSSTSSSLNGSSGGSSLYDCSEKSSTDILSKIDTNIALMRSNIQKMEKYTSPVLDKMEIEDPKLSRRKSEFDSPNYPKCWDKRAHWDDPTLPPDTVVSRPSQAITMSLKRLLKEHDDLYQL